MGFIHCERGDSKDCNACYISKATLEAEKKCNIFVHLHLVNSQNCKALNRENGLEIIDSTTSAFRLKLKEGISIIWKMPSLNKQLKRAIIPITIWSSLDLIFPFLLVLTTVLHSFCIFYKFLDAFQIIFVIAYTKKYLQSDWLRGVQYWPYLYSVFNICTLWLNQKKNTTFEFRSGKLEMYSLKTN